MQTLNSPCYIGLMLNYRQLAPAIACFKFGTIIQKLMQSGVNGHSTLIL